MASKITLGIVVLAAAIAAAAGVSLWRASHPAYAAARFDDAALSFEYPSSWEAPSWAGDPRGRVRALRLSPSGMGRPQAAGFNTRWDRGDLSLFIQVEAKAADPEKFLAGVYENSRTEGQSARPAIKTVRLGGGLSAASLSLPYTPDVLDIGVPRKPGLGESLYQRFFAGAHSETLVVFASKGKTYKITYILPGDKVARRRYERVYGRILESLTLKS